jgi:hypothetical protein
MPVRLLLMQALVRLKLPGVVVASAPGIVTNLVFSF